MSRKSRERSLEAQERWPNLWQFLAGYLHEDLMIVHGTNEQAIDQAVADLDLSGRKLVLKEWRDWNDVLGWRRDIAASMNDGLGVNVHFATEADARQLMNLVYEKLIVSVRSETASKWKP